MELLAPGGSLDSIKAAILAGADAVYCGLDRFNARSKSERISFDNLLGIINLAHQYNCEVFLTLNILILENEIPAIFSLLNKLQSTNIDGLIIQDLGLFYIVSEYFKTLNIHASTQATIHNKGQIEFLKHLSVSRVNLSRELNLLEIRELTKYASNCSMQTEVFVHGSYCISFSGLCYISSLQSGNSGNRGRCNQSCRDKYSTTDNISPYPLNLKDNSAFTMLEELAKAGVYSLKIEGRVKKYDYVYSVVDLWRKQIDKYYHQEKLSQDISAFYKVFNRDFTNGYLCGKIDNQMYIDNPRDYSINYLAQKNNYLNAEDKEKIELKFYEEKNQQKESIKHKIGRLNFSKKELVIRVLGTLGSPLEIKLITEDSELTLFSERVLVKNDSNPINSVSIEKKFRSLNDTEYHVKEINLDGLGDNLSIPFKELNIFKKEILVALQGNRARVSQICFPKVEGKDEITKPPQLSVLISDVKDLYLCAETKAQCYFLLPSNLGNRYAFYLDLFRNNKRLIPYFPSILIAEDFEVSSRFVKELSAEKIVTNNTGLGLVAYQEGIDWIAGPQLNITNSFSLLALKERFSCSGAFISNEINKNQIKNIKVPQGLDLHYSIYHPIMTMISRQCFFQKVTGCDKHILDNTCIEKCNKSASLTNNKEETYFVEKSEGNYNELYNQSNCLNTDIISDITNKFSGFMIDLRNIETKTQLMLSKLDIIQLFESAIAGNINSAESLQRVISTSNNTQYLKGFL